MWYGNLPWQYTRPKSNDLNKNTAIKIKQYDCFYNDIQNYHQSTMAIPKVSGLDILDNNIFHNLYISETYILYEL